MHFVNNFMVRYFKFFEQIYRKQATDMGFDEYHLFLMCVQFDFASFKENADQPPPLFITALQEDDPNVDRYTLSSPSFNQIPAALSLKSNLGDLYKYDDKIIFCKKVPSQKIRHYLKYILVLFSCFLYYQYSNYLIFFGKFVVNEFLVPHEYASTEVSCKPTHELVATFWATNLSQFPKRSRMVVTNKPTV